MSDTPGTMNAIGWAVKHLWHGDQVRRSGWNGKGMWLILVRPESDVGAGYGWQLLADNGHHRSVVSMDGHRLLPWIGMKTADGGFVPWLASQTDILSIDWELAF